ncbi:hypothetical protein J0910_24700 [Nocardiopsis sp. CNT-189]|uniref:hypothetical protein n=1 Tax=Nocardiopsis oceanisediminis TaxID=2816862 RepID=UPI003B3055F0
MTTVKTRFPPRPRPGPSLLLLCLLLLWSLVARLPLGLLSDALLFGVHTATGEVSPAGAVSSAAVVSAIAGALVQGRLLDRHRPAAVLGAFAAAQTAVLPVLSAATAARSPSVPLLVLAAAAAGFCIPSVSAVTRLVLKRAVAPARLNTVFTADLVLLEAVFAAGPAIAAAAAAAGGAPALFACGALIVPAGTALFLHAAHRVGSAAAAGAAAEGADGAGRGGERGGAASTGPQPADAPPPGGRLSAPPSAGAGGPAPARGLRPWYAVLRILPAAALAGAPLGLVEAGLLRLAAERSATVAPVGAALSLFALGSLVGGLLFAAVRRPARPGRAIALLCLAQAAALAAVATGPGFTAAGAALAAAGLCAVPQLSLFLQLIDRAAPPSGWAQAQSLGGVADTVGSAAGLAAGAAAAGALGSGAVLSAAVAAALAAVPVLAWALRG